MATTATALISDEKLELVCSALSLVGLPVDEWETFGNHIRNEENYQWGEVEWTERAAGTRFVIRRNSTTGLIEEVDVYRHTAYQPRFTDAQIDDANWLLRRAFA